MHDLIVNGKGLLSDELAKKLATSGHQVETLGIDDIDVQQYFDAATSAGKFYKNIFVNALDIGSEIDGFSEDPVAAIDALEVRLCNFLKVLKYGAQSMARNDGGAIWVLCLDHSINYSVNSPSNPITNYALIAAVKSIAKEVQRFNVTVNVFMTHPAAEQFDRAEWISAREKLKIFGMKYKPQPIEKLVSFIHMHSELNNPYITGGIIPAGTGLVEHNI